MRRGQAARASAVYRNFADAVRQAVAQARLSAEIAVHKARPLDWLRSGPGKETPTAPGWTSNVRAAAPTTAADLGRAEVQKMIAILLDLLGPHPELRVTLARALTAV
jgi:hypothetical protein